MPSQLPSTDMSRSTVNNFGLGTYDSKSDCPNDEGDSEPRGIKSVPSETNTDANNEDDDQDLYFGYKTSSTLLPGDYDKPPRRNKKSEESIVESVVHSVAQSELPHDEDNPSAHSDYYDKTSIGATELPSPTLNNKGMDKALGINCISIENVNDKISFPIMEEEIKDIDDKKSVPTGDTAMKRQATDLELVGTITKDFIKKYGKKDLTRRHVMAFLQKEGYHQYLASDVVRCLQQRHNVDIADVLDQFPTSTKTASKRVGFVGSMDNLNKTVFEAVASAPGNNMELKRCAAELMRSVSDLVRGVKNG